VTGSDTPVGARTARCCSQARDRARVRREFRGLRCAQGLAADDTGGRARRPMYGRATDARDGPGRRDPGQAGAHHDQRQGGAVPARSRQPPVLRTSAKHAVGLRLHLRRDLGGVRLRRSRHRYLC